MCFEIIKGFQSSRSASINIYKIDDLELRIKRTLPMFGSS